jgi:hypothetical protein
MNRLYVTFDDPLEQIFFKKSMNYLSTGSRHCSTVCSRTVGALAYKRPYVRAYMYRRAHDENRQQVRDMHASLTCIQ